MTEGRRDIPLFLQQSGLAFVNAIAALVWWAAPFKWLDTGATQPSGQVDGSKSTLTFITNTVQRESNAASVVEAVVTGNALRAILVHPEASGEVTEILFEAGQRGSRGEALLRLDDREERLAVELARIQVEDARQTLRRYVSVAPSGAVSASEVDGARTALSIAIWPPHARPAPRPRATTDRAAADSAQGVDPCCMHPRLGVGRNSGVRWGGAPRAQVDAVEEQVVQAALSYRQALLFAMEDVEAALLSYDGARARRDALSGAVASNRQAFERSSALYRQGFATFLDVLDSQRTLNAALQDLAIAERDIALALIDLFSALGLAQKPDDQAPHQASPDRASFRRRDSSSLR